MLYKTQKYYDYLEVFGHPDCPTCVLLSKWRSSYIDTFLYECVNDRSMRKRIRETGGFCKEHALAMMKKGDPLGHSVIYTTLIDEYIEAMNKKMKQGCLMCDLEVLHEQILLKSFIDSFINSDEFAQKFADTKSCICRPHLKQMKKLTRNKNIISKLDAVQIENLKYAKCCLDEIIRKHDYRYNKEQLTKEEEIAWKRAVKLMSGILDD